jgi:hypothetical protein
LTIDDRTDQGPVHVEVAGPEVLDPVAPLGLVEALEGARQPVAARVDQVDRVVEVARPHHARDRPEELLAVAR